MKKLFLLQFVLLTSTFAISQTNIETYLSVPFPSNLTGSTDGKTIAWVFNNKGERNIFLATAPSYSTKQITDYKGDEGIDINSLNFTPDGNLLAFIRGNTNNSRGEAANPALLQTSTERNLFIINKDGNKLRKVGPGSYPKFSPDGKTIAYLNGGQVWLAVLSDSILKPEKLFQSRGNQSQIRWSPDGNKIVFTSSRGDHSFIGIYDFTTKAIHFIDPSIDLDDEPAWSPDGQQLVFRRSPSVKNSLPFTPKREGYPWSIKSYNVTTGMTKEVWKADLGTGSVSTNEIPVVDNQLLWATDNHLIFPWEKNGWQQLYALNLTSGKTKNLTPGEGEVENVTLSKNLQTIYYTTNIDDINRRHIWKVDVKTGIQVQLSKTQNSEWSPIETDKNLVVLHASAQRPAWPALLSINGAVTDLAKEYFPPSFPIIHGNSTSYYDYRN